MRINKRVLTLLSITAISIGLAACTDDSQTKTDATQVNETSDQYLIQEEAKPQTIVGGLKMTIDKQEINQKITEDGDYSLHTFTITAENMGSVPAGLGSIDFLLETQAGDVIELDHTMAMFGNEIAVGESITGNVSFALEENQKAEKLIYQPGEEQLTEWDVQSE
ncbi:hypothetical protein [Enterococcus sp.]|uniref:hypothetical protein n=1 Tax=Enterococcus sp. TaxID=35783 RepID=UPI0028AAC3A7|nr:hypothetical protein [Enterococcus sp.]